MNKSAKIKTLGALSLLGGALVLSSCTASFCSNKDLANIAYAYEQGVTVYCSEDEIPEEYRGAGLSWKAIEGNDSVYAYIPVSSTGSFSSNKATYLVNSVITNASNSYYDIPNYEFWKALDAKVLGAAIEASGVDKNTVTAEQINPYSLPDATGMEADVTINRDSILRNYGYLKFYGDGDTLFGNLDKWIGEIDVELGVSSSVSNDFLTYYKQTLTTLMNNNRSCIATVENGVTDNHYGHYGPNSNWEVSIELKDWGYAWGKGFLEGLIVYPVAWMVDTFSNAMDPALSGWGQIWAIVFVTFIVRAVVQLVTLKSTLDQQRTQAIQPQLAKIQAKYPNSNTNQAERQRLSQETALLYKRNKINPLSMLLVLVFQFPIFISVWGALQGSAALTSGEVLNLQLSSSISSILSDFSGEWYLNSNGWWTAAVLFLIMAVLQFLAMMLPQWINKHRNKKLRKLTANPAADKNSKTMKWVNIVMLAMTIIMGFSLPAAMGLYWAIGALISMLQTSITQYFMGRRLNKGK